MDSMVVADIEFGVHFVIIDLLSLHAVLQGQLVILYHLHHLQFWSSGDGYICEWW